MQRGAVVDAITGHRDDMTPAPQGTRDLELLFGLDSSQNDAVVVDQGAEDLEIIRQLVALQDHDGVAEQPDLLRDGPGGQGMISGDHRDLHAGAAAAGDGIACVTPGRVLEPDDADECQCSFGVVGTVRDCSVKVTGCDRQHAQTLRSHVDDHVMDAADRAADRQHRVGRALDEDVIASDHRHAASPSIEGKAADLGFAGDLVVEVGTGPQRQCVQRGFHRVARRDPRRPGLHDTSVGTAGRNDRTASHRVAHGAVGVDRRGRLVALADDARPAGRGPRVDDCHAILGERPGLVGAHERRRTEGLDRLESTDERMSPRHALRADGERQRHGWEQSLGYERDRDTDREQEAVACVGPDEESEREEQRADPDRDESDHAYDSRKLARQWSRPTTARLRHRRDAGEACRRARRHRGRPGLAFDHERSREERRSRFDADRVALPGQRGSVNEERMRYIDPKVATDAITRDTEDDIVDDQLRGVELDGVCVPQHGDAPRQEVTEAFGRALGAELLHEREHSVEHDDGEDRDAELHQPGDDRQRAGDPQHQREEMHELTQQLPPGRNASRDRKPIRTVTREPSRRLTPRKAIGGRARRAHSRSLALVICHRAPLVR